MIYLASPYTYNNGSVALQSQIKHARFKMVELQTALYIQHGRPVLSPIVHCHELAGHYNLPGNFEYWKKMNRAWLRCCHELHVLQLPGWEKSTGVVGEIEFADSLGIWTISIPWESLRLTILNGAHGDNLHSGLHGMIDLLECADY